MFWNRETRLVPGDQSRQITDDTGTASIHRWLADGFIAGRAKYSGRSMADSDHDELRTSIMQQAPTDYLPTLEGTRKLGVLRQTVMQRVKRGAGVSHLPANSSKAA
jgi:hypothetical protein